MRTKRNGYIPQCLLDMMDGALEITEDKGVRYRQKMFY